MVGRSSTTVAITMTTESSTVSKYCRYLYEWFLPFTLPCISAASASLLGWRSFNSVSSFLSPPSIVVWSFGRMHSSHYKFNAQHCTNNWCEYSSTSMLLWLKCRFDTKVQDLEIQAMFLASLLQYTVVIHCKNYLVKVTSDSSYSSFRYHWTGEYTLWKEFVITIHHLLTIPLGFIKKPINQHSGQGFLLLWSCIPHMVEVSGI